MKSAFHLLIVAFLITFGAGVWAGCSVDFSASEPDLFSCDDDSDCLDPEFECSDEGFCDEPQVVEPGNNDNGNGEDLVCDPNDPDYPPEEPLDIFEACDGTDTNCDGEIDVIYCDDGSCPSATEDRHGTRLNYRCNDQLSPPQCEAFAPDEFGEGDCHLPIACDSEAGRYEDVPAACGGEGPADSGNGGNAGANANAGNGGNAGDDGNAGDGD